MEQVTVPQERSASPPLSAAAVDLKLACFGSDQRAKEPAAAVSAARYSILVY